MWNACRSTDILFFPKWAFYSSITLSWRNLTGLALRTGVSIFASGAVHGARFCDALDVAGLGVKWCKGSHLLELFYFFMFAHKFICYHHFVLHICFSPSLWPVQSGDGGSTVTEKTAVAALLLPFTQVMLHTRLYVHSHTRRPVLMLSFSGQVCSPRVEILRSWVLCLCGSWLRS